MTYPRIAVISDIHGNLPALEAVWSEIELAAPDLIVNLGDIASGPLWPRETVEWLMNRETLAPTLWRTIAGNHERQVLDPDVGRMSPARPSEGARTAGRQAGGCPMSATDAFAARELGATERTWLAGLLSSMWITDDVLLCHGTPANDLTYFMETVTPGVTVDGHPGVRAATAAELGARAAEMALAPMPDGPPTLRSGLAAALILCGHTHVARAMAVANGPLVVNPGSVGLQAYDDVHPHPHFIEAGSPHARWALVEHDAQAAWRVQLRATAYDWQAAAARAQVNGRGDWADALASGFVGRTETVVAGTAR